MWVLGEKTRRKKIRSFFIGLTIIITIPVLVNILFGDFNQFTSFGQFLKEVSYGFFLGAFYWLGNFSIGILVGRHLNWRKNPKRANLISLLSFIFTGMIVSVIVPYIYAKYVWLVPDDRVVYSTVVNAFFALSIDVIIISIFYSSYLVKFWGESIKNEEELKRENLIARYEALKNQVNPHFLFNSLNALSGVVEQDPGKAPEFIRKLSDIYRYVLEQKDKECIDIAEETGFVDDYVYLLKIRYGEGLQVENNIRETGVGIVPLGLQILVENAIKHNEISDDRPLRVEIGMDDSYIFVRNNLQRKSTVGQTNRVGLENLVKRYEYVSNRKVLIIDTDQLFEVKLPRIDSPRGLP